MSRDTNRPAGSNLEARIDAGRLSRKGRELALAIVTFGVVTFFVPTIKAGNEYVSPFDVSVILRAAMNEGRDIPPVFVSFGLAYLLFVVIAGTVLLLPLRKLLQTISLTGLCILLFPFAGIWGALRLAAFVQSPGIGDISTLWVVLGIAMFGLAAVAWTDTTI